MPLPSKVSLLLLVFFSVLFMEGFAQQTALSGRVRDAETGKALEFATVALLAVTDSVVVTGATADLEGQFSFTAPEVKQWIIREIPLTL